MELLANDVALTRLVGRPIIDKIGLTSQFDIHLDFAPDVPSAVASVEITSAPSMPTGVTLFDALRQLGLRLEPAKGPVEVLVIDHLERPSEN
jgi:uncharacterized protein (TIGR03435 family)